MVDVMAMGSRKGMEEEAEMDVMMVNQMVRLVTVPRCMEEEVEKFMREDTAIFVPRLHRMGQCKAMVNMLTKLKLVATKQMMEEEVMNVRVVKLMVKMKTVPGSMVVKVDRFMQGDTVIFVTRLHRVEQCKTKEMLM